MYSEIASAYCTEASSGPQPNRVGPMSTTDLPARTPGPMRADARRNRELLLTAALAAFTEHGADDVSLEEIARRAGVGIGTLYRHFPTRQELLEAVYRDQVEALCALAAGLLREPSPGEALGTWLRGMIAFSTTKRSLVTSMLATMDKTAELFSVCSTEIRRAVESLLVRAQEAGEIRGDVDATDVMRLSHAITVATERAPENPEQAERLLGLMLDGLRAGTPGARPPG
jgi:AcrR family transcriptional regulator